MAAPDHKQCMNDVYGGDPEPQVTEYKVAVFVIKDGRGGVCRFDSSEINDLIVQLSSAIPNDGPALTVIDLTDKTSV